MFVKIFLPILAVGMFVGLCWTFWYGLTQPVVYRSNNTGEVEKVLDRSGVEHPGDSIIAREILGGQYDVVHTQ